MLAAIEPDEFLFAFMRWIRAVRHLCREGVVAVDGKALRRAREAGEKGNEIAAVPELLDALDLGAAS